MPRWPARLIAFVAGFASLLWQTTALRIGIQEIGANRSTSAAILAVSLFGLAIGAVGFGKLADSSARRGRLAASLLLIISIATILFAFAGRDFAGLLARSFAASGPTGSGFASLAYAFAVVLPIHAIIGGLIPVLISLNSLNSNGHASESRPADCGAAVAALYAIETLGAASGGLAAVFLLVPNVGIFQTLMGCGIAGLIISGFCFFGLKESCSNRITTIVQDDRELPTAAVPRTTILLVAVFLCSFASLGMELVWQRYFVFVFGSDSRSYAVVVAAMLVGISLGSAMASMGWIRRRLSYPVCLIFISGSIAGSLLVLGFGMKAETLQSSLNFLLWSPFVSRFSLALAVILLPATCIGLSIPIVSTLLVKAAGTAGADLGKLYATMAIGNVAGVFVCASVLIPNFGLHSTALLLSAAPFVGGGLVYFAIGRQSDSQISATMATAGVALVCLTCFGIAVLNPTRAGLIDQVGWEEVFYFEDGIESVAVLQSDADSTVRRLMIDGVTIGESGGGVDKKQQMLAHLPFLLRTPNSNQHVYTIGLGSGILANELADHEAVDRVIVAELSPGVIQATDFFSQQNPNPAAAAKIQIINDDGIRFLQQSTERFDVIVSDGKSRPGAASNISFFSTDYYRLCENRLSENGIFVQWVSLRCDANELVTIANTFAGSFPFGHIGLSSPNSIYLIGSRTALDLDTNRLNEQLDVPNADSLRRYGFGSADDILSMYWLDQSVLASNRDSSFAVNTYNRPILENYSWGSFRHSVQNLKPPVEILQSWIELDSERHFNGKANEDIALLKARRASDQILKADSIVLNRKENWLDRAADHWKRALTLLPELNRQNQIADLYRQLAVDSRTSGDESTEFSALLNVIELNCGTADDRYRAAMILESKGAHEKALQYHYDAAKHSPEDSNFLIAFAECLMMTQKFSRAKAELSKVKDSPSTPLAKKKAELLDDICTFKMQNDPYLLQRIALRATEDPSFPKLLGKFQIRF